MEEHKIYKTAKACLCGCGKVTTRKAKFARGCEVRLQYRYIRDEVAADRALARLEVAKAEAAKAVELAQKAKQVMESFGWPKCPHFAMRRRSAKSSAIFKVA